MITIRVAFGGTVNLGNFENVKIDLEVSQDCATTSLEEALDQMQHVETELKAEYFRQKRELLTDTQD